MTCAAISVVCAQRTVFCAYGRRGDGALGRFTLHASRAIRVGGTFRLATWAQEACAGDVVRIERSFADITTRKAPSHRRRVDLTGDQANHQPCRDHRHTLHIVLTELWVEGPVECHVDTDIYSAVLVRLRVVIRFERVNIGEIFEDDDVDFVLGVHPCIGATCI